MKFKIKRDILLNNIDKIQNIISVKPTLPILSNILIEAQRGTLKFTTTDLNIGINCVVSVDIQEPGAIAIPAKRFSSIIKELLSEEVEITTHKNNTMFIETSDCQFKIIGLSAEEFPKLPEFRDKEVIKLEQVDLREMLDLTSFVISLDETRYILNGVLFRLYDEKITLVATDGKRLAIAEKKLKERIGKEIRIIIPLKTIHEVNRNLKEEGKVSLIIGTNQVLFDFGEVVIISRLIEGEFPEYQQVVPPPSETKLKVDREELLGAMKRAALLATSDYQAVKLEVFKNKLVVSKSTPEVGESREEISIEYSGKELVVGFNPVYVIDVLKNLSCSQIEWELTGPEKPGVMRMPGYIYLVLPMRLG